MNNKDAWQNYVEYTQLTSDNSRKLAFAATAVCWFFRSDGGSFPLLVLVALILLVLFFALDLLQSTIASVLLRRWIRRREGEHWAKHQTIEGDYDLPPSLDRVPYACWRLKVAALFAAFGVLGAHLIP